MKQTDAYCTTVHLEFSQGCMMSSAFGPVWMKQTSSESRINWGHKRSFQQHLGISENFFFSLLLFCKPKLKTKNSWSSPFKWKSTNLFSFTFWIFAHLLSPLLRDVWCLHWLRDKSIWASDGVFLLNGCSFVVCL